MSIKLPADFLMNKTESSDMDKTATENTSSQAKPILQVKDLKVYFEMNKTVKPDESASFFSKVFPKKEKVYLKAVDGVSFDLYKGEILALVGESGCGKSTTARGILQLHRPREGQVILEGQELTTLSPRELKKCRQKIQMVFQDPYASLNPRMTVGDVIAEPAKVFRTYKNRSDLQTALIDTMKKVGLEKKFIHRYPHAFSGGQRQRIGIARALISQPEIIVADEPVSALDVSIQAQVLNLFSDLQKDLGLTYVFIAHDLSVVKHMCTRVAVMYLGRIVEVAPTKKIFEKQRHPYTQALISAVNVPDPVIEKKRERIVLQGEIPSPLNPPHGCPFHTRCSKAQDRCRQERPYLEEKAENHQVACFFPND